MTEIRRCTKEDWEAIVELSARHKFPFPDFKNMLSAAVVVKDGKVIAFGYIKQFVEAVFVPDVTSKKNTVLSLDMLIGQLIKDTKELGIDQIHAFVPKEDYPNHLDILKKHYGFTDCIGDIVCLEVMTNGS